MMELGWVKGEPVVLRDIQSQVFIGEVKTVNEKLGRIVLKNVIQLPERIPISGYRNFDKDEIVEIRNADFEEINGDIVESPESDSPIQTTETLIKVQPPELQQLEAKNLDFNVIKNFGSDFKSAVSVIQNSPKIGLIALDTSKSRQKRASIVAVSTPTQVFIFDLLLLGDDLFVEGLGEILQSPKIEKVVHDSRLLSDCLKRKHAVSLENVRDVEAEDIMVVYQDRKTIRKHRRTLEYLIGVYLGVTVEGLDDTTGWDDRPLKEDLLQRLANVISYLIPLQEAIQEKYLKRLVDASHIYNTHVRDLDLFDYMLVKNQETLREEMIKLVAPKSDIRGNIEPKRNS